MPDNYLKLFKAMPEAKAKVDIEYSKDKMKMICENISKRKNYLAVSSIFLYPIFILIYKFWRLGLKTVSKNFKLNDQRCISCGICKDVCPVQNIELINEKPLWNKNCEDCLACVNLCPTVAISCGGKSKHDNRYKNPYIAINELKK
ncbi:MAG: EFR1 family ferrodoxin [Cetobacterium sp.]